MSEKKHSLIYRVAKFLLDIVELYIPMIAFIVLFLLFIVNIFFRYVLNNPLTWPPEMIVTGFLWLVMFSAAYVRRKGTHVKFTLVYERLSPRLQALNRILVNIVIAVVFVIAIPATIDWVQFMDFKSTTVFRVSFSIVYFPTIPFFILVAGHSVFDVFVDIRDLLQKKVQQDDVPPEMRT